MSKKAETTIPKYPRENEIADALSAPFSASEIKWMQQQSGVSEKTGGHADQPWCLATAYLDARAIQKRLDDVFGIFGWKDEYEWKGTAEESGVVCSLSVKWGNEWITKQDGAPSTHVEPFKGGISDALKRAAAKFGVGRYMYYVESLFADATFERPKGSRAKAKREGWMDGKTKDGKKFYWKAPKMPNWALPEAEQDKSDESPEGNESPVKTVKAKPRLARTDVVRDMYRAMEAKGMMEEDQAILLFAVTGETTRHNITEEMAEIMFTEIAKWEPEADKGDSNE